MVGRSINDTVAYHTNKNKMFCFKKLSFFLTKNRKKYYGILYLFINELSF